MSDPRPVHEGHPDAERCPALHYWPPETAEHNWTNATTNATTEEA